MYYRAYLLDARPSFTMLTKGKSDYVHMRYSVDEGATWKVLPQGGGSSDVITFPERTNEGNPVVKITLQVVSDKTYVDGGNAFPETVTTSNGTTYTIWVEQLPSADAVKMLTAAVDTGDWYPAFDPDVTNYKISVANGSAAPVLTYTIAAGTQATIGDEIQTPNEDGSYTLALTTSAQTVTITSADGSIRRQYSFAYFERIANGADKVVDYLCVNSQYTNTGNYGMYPEYTLGSNSLNSLGNFGGYITYYFKEGLTDNPANQYGVDFYIDGNAFKDTSTGTGLGSMEPGQVWVSEDGSAWYALAGSEHYDADTLWDYTVTYSKNGTGTSWSDNYGNSNLTVGRSFSWPLAENYPLNALAKQDSFALTGILIPSVKGITGNDEFSTYSSGARFGYVDALVNGTANPYAENDSYQNASSGFDLAWAVDDAGNPVDVSGKSFHYVKVVTASNIVAGSANEKSTEVANITRASAQNASVGVTKAPTSITFSEGDTTYELPLVQGQQVYEVALAMQNVSIAVNGSEGDNIYINNQRVASGTAATGFAVNFARETLVRVIVQNGDREPVIYLLKLTAKLGAEYAPEITKQPASAGYIVGETMVELSVEAVVQAQDATVSYQWFKNTENSTEGGTAIPNAVNAAYAPGKASEAGTYYYYCVVTSTAGEGSLSTASEVAEITVITAQDAAGKVLSGSGTEADPWQIRDAQDYQDVYDLVARGVSFSGQYLKQMKDITLPEGWESIGVRIDPSISHINRGKNMAAFSGTLDGSGRTVTVPEGGHPLLGYVKDAYVQNLSIYGKQIAGYGLVDHLEGVGLSGNAITIDNVTLKSGSSTLKSGLIGTYITNNGYAGCSGGFTVTIRNCTIEQGVVVGYDGSQSQIGSIAGRMSGTIENCVSYATVYGKDYVGGILGTRDNSMATCKVINSRFEGTVNASGTHAGGILGGGYDNDSAPNGGKTDVISCVVSGSIVGADKVGGIVGGDSFVAQLWSNMKHTLTDNTFTGTVKATEGNYVGGIIGYYYSLNRYDNIDGNFFSSVCGAENGIGYVEYLDTSCAEPDITNVGTVFSTAGGTSGCPDVKWCSWKKDCYRTDDPLGTDAAALCASTNAVLAASAEKEVVGGKSITLKVVDVNTGTQVKASEVRWTLADSEDAAYATITTAGVMKTYPVAAKCDVTLIAELSGAHTGRIKHTVTVYPAATQVEIWKGEENVTGKTLYLNAAADASLELSGKLFPIDAKEGITWTSSNTKVATVENGIVSFANMGKTGTVTITATAKDGSGRKASVTVQVGSLTETVTITDPGVTTLRSGKSLTLKAETTPAKPTIPGVTFALVNPADSAYATVSSSGKVTAKTVNEPHEIQIIATSKDATKVHSEPLTLTILPKSEQMLILKSGDEYVTGTTLVRNADAESISLSAFLLDTTDSVKQTIPETLTWKSSRESVASVDNGTVTLNKAGIAVITATSGKLKASVTIKVTNLVSEISVTPKSANDDLTIASGKAVTLKATVKPADAANKKVTWSITEGDSYAKISGSGVLTANKNLTETVRVKVTATAVDGSGIAGSAVVTINPISQGIRILLDETMEPTNTTLVWDMQQNANLNLSAKVYPIAAEQDVTWSSSSAKVAAVAQDGKVTCYKAGTVTITATAKDGSGKKASFKLTVVKRMTELTLSGNDIIAGGKSLPLKALIGPADTTNKKLTWSISENTVGAKISSSGVLTTRAVKEKSDVTITATAQDGSGKTATHKVTIYPATTQVTLRAEGYDKLPTTLAVGETLKLVASCNEGAANQYTWSSSSTKVATVDVDGVITAITPGTVTITATANDGTGKKAAIKLTVVQLMESLTLSGNDIIAGGKSLTLKALISPADTTNKKLTWSISENGVGAKISSSGKLTTKKVTEPTAVTITAAAQDGSGMTATHTVTIYPATTSVALSADGYEKIPTTLAVGKTLKLVASCNEGAANQYTWKSNNQYVTVKDGTVAADAKAVGKTVTITCTAADGTGKSASVKIKIVAAEVKN